MGNNTHTICHQEPRLAVLENHTRQNKEEHDKILTEIEKLAEKTQDIGVAIAVQNERLVALSEKIVVNTTNMAPLSDKSKKMIYALGLLIASAVAGLLALL